MRSDPANYELKVPATLAEALDLLGKAPGKWTPLAGGTDLMVVYEAGQLKSKQLLSLHQLEDLKGIECTKDWVTIGALTTYSEIRGVAEIQAEFPNLVHAASETGGLAIQNRGTIGGNIVNASPAADTPPALLVYDAEIELVSHAGSRWIPYSTFHRGYKKHDLKPEELLKSIRLKRKCAAKPIHFYRKVGTRQAQAISKVIAAGFADLKGSSLTHIRLALGSVAPVTLRCIKTEQVLTNQKLSPALISQACSVLKSEIAPIDDIRSTSVYREIVAVGVIRQFLDDLLASTSTAAKGT